MSQLVTESTRGNAILDLIIIEFDGHILYRPHLGTSDHVSLFIYLILELEILPPPPFRKVFHWSSAPWSHVRGYLRCFCWDPMCFMSIDDATAFITQAVVGAQQCYIPTSVPRCHRPTVWWNRYCHHTYILGQDESLGVW